MLTKREIPILLVNLVYIPIFTLIALRNTNYEFLLYVVVILVMVGLVIWKQQKIQFDRLILWGLTIWGFMHMAGGNLHISDDVLYGLQLLPLINCTLANGEQFIILRYDQLVHVFGFGVATLVCYHLLKPYLQDGVRHGFTLLFLIVLMATGFGAFNEIIEFAAVLIFPETGVGGYANTLLDICFNLMGGVVAVLIILLQHQKNGPAKREPILPL